VAKVEPFFEPAKLFSRKFEESFSGHFRCIPYVINRVSAIMQMND
jgi:hypothetical protein